MGVRKSIGIAKSADLHHLQPPGGTSIPLGARSSRRVVLIFSKSFLFTAATAHGEEDTAIELPQQRVRVQDKSILEQLLRLTELRSCWQEVFFGVDR